MFAVGIVAQIVISWTVVRFFTFSLLLAELKTAATTILFLRNHTKQRNRERK